MNRDTHVTSSDTGVDHDDDASDEASFSRSSKKLVETNVSTETHAKLLHEVKQLRKALYQT